MYTLSLKVTFQEVPLIGTCIMNIQEGWKLRNILGKAAATALNTLQLTFWPHLYGENL